MTYRVRANGVDPTEAFGCVVTSREIPTPERNSVMETVPYMNGFYDFSELHNGPYYKSRELKYGLAVYADDGEALADKLAKLHEWLCGIVNDELRDDVYPGWHFVASVTKTAVKMLGARGAVVTATFTCYPFRIADEETAVDLAVGDNVVTNGGMRVLVTGVTEGSTTITVGSISQSFSGEVDLDIALEHGDNAVTVEGSPCTIKWREELI